MDQNRFFSGNQEGSVLVVALMILVILTLLGISATTSTDIELRIAGNERNYKMTFFQADSGIYATPKVISACVDVDSKWLDDNKELKITSIQALGSNPDDLYMEIIGLKTYDSGPDLQYSLNNYPVKVDIKRTGVENVAGGAVEFASGAQGIGGGSAGGIALLYDLDSTGEGPAAAVATISAVYRKMIGIPGGL